MPLSSPKAPRSARGEEEPADRLATAVRQARQIAETLDRASHSTPAGAVTWFGPSGYGSEFIPLRQHQLGPHLYQGASGIALFFAAFSRFDSPDRWRTLSLEALAPLRHKLAELGDDLARAQAIRLLPGGLIGIGSWIYAFLQCGLLLDDEQLIADAHRATRLLTPERISSDRQFRVQTGAAGAILALLALDDVDPSPNASGATPLDLAAACGRHLLDHRVSINGMPPAWPLSPGKPPVAGFSYGAAGIAHALHRLGARAGTPEFLAAADGAEAFVDLHESPERASWQDARERLKLAYRLRRGTWRDWWAQGTMDDLERRETPAARENHYPDSWCHGDTGIALARCTHLATRQEWEPQTRRVLDRLDDHLDDPEWFETRTDDLCCGHAGRVELLLVASRELREPALRQRAHRWMERIETRAEKVDDYSLAAARGTDVFTPMLFQGLAGIGFTHLRLASPDEIPCILLLENPVRLRS